MENPVTSSIITPYRPTISVAMATFNGARFLEAQFESIYAQSRQPDEVVVTDDGSTDGTVKILEKYACCHGLKYRIHDRRLGAAHNFEKSLLLCSGDYIALSDQDDAWRVDKLERLYGNMLEQERLHGRAWPILAYSDLTVVDENLNVISDSIWPLTGGFPLRNSFNQLLSRNVVTGCATMINSALKTLALPFPSNIQMHDSWLGLVAAALGTLSYLPCSLMLYRQHSGNTLGANAKRRGWPRPARIFSKILSYPLGRAQVENPFLTGAIPQAKEFRLKYLKMLSSPQCRQLDDFILLEHERGLSAVANIIRNKFFLSSTREDIELLLYFMFIKGSKKARGFSC